MKIKTLIYLLSSSTLITGSAVNFNPSTGRTTYQTVTVGLYRREENFRNTTINLSTVEKHGLDLRQAKDSISHYLLERGELPPALVTLSGGEYTNVLIHFAEILQQPENAANTICRFSMKDAEEDEPEAILQSGQRVEMGDTDGWVGSIYCTSYFLVESFGSELEAWINPEIERHGYVIDKDDNGNEGGEEEEE